MLSDGLIRDSLGRNAFETIAKNRGATEKTVEYLKQLLTSQTVS
jgi:hypothetical protein